jgi:MFS family permease
VNGDSQKPLWPAATLLALTGLNLFNYLDRQVLPAVLTPLKEELRLTDSQLGSVATAFMLGYFVTSPFFGWLGDRVARKWLIVAGVAVWSLGTVLSGVAGTFASLVMFRVLVGLGEASYGTISPGWIADLYPPARRNNALTIFYVAIPVGSALGYILGGYVAAHHGWRSAFMWAGAPGLLLAFCLLVLREPRRGASDAPESLPPSSTGPAGGWSGYLALIKIPAYVLVVLGYIAQTFALGGFSYWAPTFLQRVHGMPLEAADHFFGLSLVVTGLTATLLGGFVATAWQRRHPAGYAWMLGLSAALAVPVGFAAFLLSDPAQAKVALVAAMFLLFLSTGPTNTLILETVPVAQRASAMAASIFAIHFFGDLWSPKIIGMLSDRWGSLRQAVLLLPAALVISAGFWIWLAVRTPKAAAVAT